MLSRDWSVFPRGARHCSTMLAQCFTPKSQLPHFTVDMPAYLEHFTTLSQEKVRCNYCKEDIKYVNSHLHSSNLRNHLNFKHPLVLKPNEKAKVPKIQD